MWPEERLGDFRSWPPGIVTVSCPQFSQRRGGEMRTGGETIQKERKNAEMEKGLKMGISCACL